MWQALGIALKELGALWLKQRRAKAYAEISFQKQLAQAEADWDMVALQQSQYSWKDELIAIVWYSPLIVAWFDIQRANDWVAWVSELPLFYQVGMFGIMAAAFGLRWYFKREDFKVMRGKKNVRTP